MMTQVILIFQLFVCLIRTVFIFVLEAMIVGLVRRGHSRSFIKKTNQELSFFQKTTKFCYWNVAKRTLDKIFLRCFIVYRLFLIIMLLVAFVMTILFFVIDYQERYMIYFLWGLSAEFFAMIFLIIYELIYQENGPRKWLSKKDGQFFMLAFIVFVLIVIMAICVKFLPSLIG